MRFKKKISWLLSMVMVLQLCVIGVSAKTAENNIFQGNGISKELTMFLEDNGIAVTEDTIVEKKALTSDLSTYTERNAQVQTALVVTNIVDETTVEKDTIILIGENEIIDIDDILTSKTRDSDTFYSLDAVKIVLRGKGVYSEYRPGDSFQYFRPTSASVYYTKVKSCTVNSIGLDFICAGQLYSYPSYSLINNLYSYCISVNKSNPQASTIFTNSSNPLSSNRCIRTSEGAESGTFLTFTFTIDGVSDGYTLRDI